MKKSELKKIIKEELKAILKEDTDSITQSDVEGAVSSFLSDEISKNFVRYVKSGKIKVLPITGLSGSGAYRAKSNTVEFVIEPKDLQTPPIRIELVINADMRKYNLFRNKRKK